MTILQPILSLFLSLTLTHLPLFGDTSTSLDSYLEDDFSEPISLFSDSPPSSPSQLPSPTNTPNTTELPKPKIKIKGWVKNSLSKNFTLLISINNQPKSIPLEENQSIIGENLVLKEIWVDNQHYPKNILLKIYDNQSNSLISVYSNRSKKPLPTPTRFTNNAQNSNSATIADELSPSPKSLNNPTILSSLCNQ